MQQHQCCQQLSRHATNSGCSDEAMDMTAPAAKRHKPAAHETTAHHPLTAAVLRDITGLIQSMWAVFQTKLFADDVPNILGFSSLPAVAANFGLNELCITMVQARIQASQVSTDITCLPAAAASPAQVFWTAFLMFV